MPLQIETPGRIIGLSGTAEKDLMALDVIFLRRNAIDFAVLIDCYPEVSPEKDRMKMTARDKALHAGPSLSERRRNRR